MCRYKLNDKVTVISCLLSDMTDLSGFLGTIVGKKRMGGLLWYVVSIDVAVGSRTVQLLRHQITPYKI